MNRIIGAVALLTLTCACEKQPEHAPQSNEQKAPGPVAPASKASVNEAGSGGLADSRPVVETKGPIDPKSAEAAAQVVQHYGALIEQKRWTESWQLWSNVDAAKEFDRNWRNDAEVHIEIGKSGDMEGAAGSSYVTIPTVFYGKTKSGTSFRRSGDMILRRVNDVPGSTDAQRHWHIERIELKAKG